MTRVIQTLYSLSVWTVAGLFLVAAPSDGAAQSAQRAVAITSPTNGVTVPRTGRDPCSSAGPCRMITVEGRVPVGYWPFIIVAPVAAAPRMWIMPPVPGVGADGQFTGLAYAGEERAGANQQYQLFICAHKNRARFRDGDLITSIPRDCLVSDGVTVTRVR